MAVNIFVHRRDADNAGDFWSSPGVYLSNIMPVTGVYDYNDLPQVDVSGTVDRLIIGGGGIGAKFLAPVWRFMDRVPVRNLVVWGTAWEKGREDLDQLASRSSLIGVREWFDDLEWQRRWVPCASAYHCALPRLRKSQATQDWLIVDHWKRGPIKFPLSATRISNYRTAIQAILESIANHHFVLTSSYHAAYWATLLGRRAVFCSLPWMPKVCLSRWPIPAAETFSWGMLDHAHRYPTALDEALAANRAFYQEITNLG